MTLTIEIPDSLASCWPPDCADRSRTVLEDFAVESYRNGRFSAHQVGELLGHASRWETEAFLAAHEAWPATTAAELDAGLEHLDRFLAGVSEP